MPRRRSALAWRFPPVLVLVMAAAGCLEDRRGFVCGASGSCSPGRECIAASCARVDPMCSSGYRWDDSAGSRASQCATVAGDGGHGLADARSEDDAAFADFPILAGDAGDALCGNGMLDPGETCDPSVPAAPCPKIADCDDHEACTNDSLIGAACHQLCVHDYQGHGDGTACTAGANALPGQCRSHVCCVGCWNGTYCQPGKSTAACGTAGGDCADCAKNPPECAVRSCGSDGKCASQSSADGTACTGGVCHGGLCCTGCLLPGAGSCQPGNLATACGSGGAVCQSCTANNSCGTGGGNANHCLGCQPLCGGKSCGSDGCGGSCPPGCGSNQMCSGATCVCLGTAENTDSLCSNGIDDNCNTFTDCIDPGCALKACSPQGGSFCQGTTCISGCRIGGVFYAPGAAHPSDPCRGCVPPMNDSDWTPIPDGGACKLGGALGKCHAGGCCTGCWNTAGNICVPPGSVQLIQCGTGGASCVNCDDGNPCTTHSCDAGACATMLAPDGTLCKAVGCGFCSVGCASGSCLLGYACKLGVCDMNNPGAATQCCAKYCCGGRFAGGPSMCSAGPCSE